MVAGTCLLVNPQRPLPELLEKLTVEVIDFFLVLLVSDRRLRCML